MFFNEKITSKPSLASLATSCKAPCSSNRCVALWIVIIFFCEY
jgi:hypothetical protein